MIFATLKLEKVVLVIKGDSFEKMMKDIGYILAKFPHKIGGSYILKFITKGEFDLSMEVANKNPKTKTVEIKSRRRGKRKIK